MISDCPPGFSFLLNGHLWTVVASSPHVSEEVLIVFLTTKKDNSDTTVVLQPGDHDFIRHETVVSYADTRIITRQNLITRINEKDFELRKPFDPDKVKLIQSGLLNSPHTPEDKKEFFRKFHKSS